MLCPIDPAHTLVEIADDLFQCPVCGFGPSTSGYRDYWAVYGVGQVGDDELEAVCCRLDQHTGDYIINEVRWLPGVRGSFVEEEGVRLAADDLDESPLPAVVLDPNKWSKPPGVPKLRGQMFPTPLGVKELALSRGRR